RLDARADSIRPLSVIISRLLGASRDEVGLAGQLGEVADRRRSSRREVNLHGAPRGVIALPNCRPVPGAIMSPRDVGHLSRTDPRYVLTRRRRAPRRERLSRSSVARSSGSTTRAPRTLLGGGGGSVSERSTRGLADRDASLVDPGGTS